MHQIIHSRSVGIGIGSQEIDTNQTSCEVDLYIDQGASVESESWTSSGREGIAIIPSPSVVASLLGMSMC